MLPTQSGRVYVNGASILQVATVHNTWIFDLSALGRGYMKRRERQGSIDSTGKIDNTDNEFPTSNMYSNMNNNNNNNNNSNNNNKIKMDKIDKSAPARSTRERLTSQAFDFFHVMCIHPQLVKVGFQFDRSDKQVSVVCCTLCYKLQITNYNLVGSWYLLSIDS